MAVVQEMAFFDALMPQIPAYMASIYQSLQCPPATKGLTFRTRQSLVLMVGQIVLRPANPALEDIGLEEARLLVEALLVDMVCIRRPVYPASLRSHSAGAHHLRMHGALVMAAGPPHVLAVVATCYIPVALHTLSGSEPLPADPSPSDLLGSPAHTPASEVPP